MGVEIRTKPDLFNIQTRPTQVATLGTLFPHDYFICTLLPLQKE